MSTKNIKKTLKNEVRIIVEVAKYGDKIIKVI